MTLRQPVAVNKLEKPVIIFKDGTELKEFPSIQTASKWLKKYSGYDYIPYKQVERGILFGETWLHRGSMYAFTTDENVRLAKLEELGIETENKSESKVEPTGFWTFFCNPKKWAIDDFLASNKVEDTFSITSWQKDWFSEGQLGVIRVGHDSRNKEELNSKPRLKRGIYAVVEVNGDPFYSTEKDGFYYEGFENEGYRVPVRYIRNLLNRPILLEDLNLEDHEYDKYLVEGFQASSMPLNPQTLLKISTMVDTPETTTTYPYKVGSEYSRKDIYKILNVPENKQDGIWNTGYTTYNNDIYIFASINSSGRTGHDYDNKFIGDELQWFSKGNHSLSTPSIQAMLNPKGNIFIFTREDSSNTNFVYQGNGRVKEYEDTKPVKIIWEFNDENEEYPNKITEEVDNSKVYTEGATKQVSVNVYERNPVARRKCIEHYGSSCEVCDFNFERTYGDLGKDFIHVHHLKELHTISEEYEVNPITDLRPVCPNCHAMLHKRKPAYSIYELKGILYGN
ncbi:DUF3427 domain-containing protein [Oceanobacillus zhaokaii]|uniref:DUF3427 domain-containing protein n=1 Tax=Oceanobacillus zhaokaii TaxID=2052660 RepID=A0A345PM56_9BACI|nr:DUF3427 domain-containing protein [Oceanobacillus zhaokaii]AXI11086.1 DUF3427 domain-containing protein [Oceanobacillus zhaokaii]